MIEFFTQILLLFIMKSISLSSLFIIKHNKGNSKILNLYMTFDVED
jgi:hypothetical protein